MPKPTKEDIKTILTTDARFKVFKEKIKKLGYIKQDAVEVRKVMEKQSDFSMMSDAGNKKIARAVAQAKNEKDLKSRLEKISKMAGGKYSEASEDEVLQRAIDAWNDKSSGSAAWADNNIFVQLKKFTDTKRDGDVMTKDNKKTKVKGKDAAKVHDILMQVKAPIRDKYIRLLAKDAKSFKKTFDAIASLKVN
jgi:hypothetical protein